jgi:hypothetical protein
MHLFDAEAELPHFGRKKTLCRYLLKPQREEQTSTTICAALAGIDIAKSYLGGTIK